MGFNSFIEKYYLNNLNIFEKKDLDNNDLYLIKQLYKLLDDLIDEGYKDLPNYLEEKLLIRTRLFLLLKNNKEEPFVNNHLINDHLKYHNQIKINDLSYELLNKSLLSNSNNNDFLNNLISYCKWIKIDQDTSYIFLLRDTYLLYLYFVNKYPNNNFYPYIINRDFLKDISKTEFDTLVRAPIYEALEQGIDHYDEFFLFCKEKILKILDNFLNVKQILLDLLNKIKTKKIMVIESGYSGTICLLLKALDERVDFRLYTTAPFLFKIYQEKIFTKKYEEMRMFETLYTHNLLIKYDHFYNGAFYVKVVDDDDIYQKALTEIKKVIKN